MLFPGDRVDQAVEEQLSRLTVKGKPVEGVRLGPGLRHSFDQSQPTDLCIRSSGAGRLAHRPPNRFWLEAARPRRRYCPRPGDLVIGRILVRTAEYYRVELGGSHPALLQCATGFESASRRARPNLSVGALVFARVVQAERFIEPEVVCVGTDGKAGGFGELPPVKPLGSGKAIAGFAVFRCAVDRAWKLQRPDCQLLADLGKLVPFEIVIGANGWFAIDSPLPAITLALRNCIDLDAIPPNLAGELRLLARQLSSEKEAKE